MPASKQTSAMRVSHPRTEAEVHLARARILERYITEGLHHDDDHPADVISDMLDELLQLRALREKVVQQQNELKPFFIRK